MAIQENDDLTRRFRAYQPSAQPRRTLNDVRKPTTRPFPTRTSALSPIAQPVRVTRPAPTRSEERPTPMPAKPVVPTGASGTPPRSPRQPTRSTVPPQEPRQKRRRFRLTRKIIIRTVLVLLLCVVLGGGWFGYKAVSNIQKVFHGGIFTVLTTTKLRGEDVGRVNILLAGNSADDPLHQGADLTDSIMMISIDTKNNTALMLSIPRDLWVDIPGYGHAKINEAYVDGENGNFSAPGYPNGGMGLLDEVVSNTLGIQANYYALVDYNALRDAVNDVGGVDITVQSVDPRGLYDPSYDWNQGGPLVKLPNGVDHLNGAQALGLARARGDSYGSYGFPRSDFDRTQNQRELILAIKNKVLKLGTLANPITMANLFDTLGTNVKTDFTLGEVRRLYDIGKNLNNSNIQSVGLDNVNGVNLLANYTSPNHESALIPAAGIDTFTTIQQQITRLMTDDPIARENAAIVVLNGTNTAGVAASTQQQLIAKKLTVAEIADARATAAGTTIIDATTANSPKPATLALLKTIFPGATVTTTNPYANAYTADFIVIVGSDWAAAHITTPPQ